MNEYFESKAKTRVNDRLRYSYYWNDISKYVNYFSNSSLSILEIGCGTGELLNDINGGHKIGIDFSPSIIDIAKSRHPHIEFKVMKAESLELNTKYDLIILSNLIGYLHDVQTVFEELRKVSHSRTKIIINYYNRGWEPILRFSEFIGLKRKSPEQNWLSVNDVRNLLTLSGFQVYREHKRMLLPVNIPLLSPFINSFFSQLPFINRLCINNYTFATQVTNLNEEDVSEEYSVSIIIPARNESANIEPCITRTPNFGKSQEIIFVEGNSTDDTWDKMNEVLPRYSGTHNVSMYKQKGKGKSDAVRLGFSKATGDILIILDADMTVPPEELYKFYNAIATCKGDFINGSRLVYPMENNAMRPLNIMGNKAFSMIFSWLLQQPFKDTLCGTKVIFRKDYINLEKNRAYFGEFDPFGDYDLIFGAYKLNLKIIELPVHYKERKYGTTNISRFKHGLILLKMCIIAARKIKFT